MTGISSDLRILVAEDNEINRRMVASMLARLDLSAEFVSNGNEAVERVLTDSFDIVLMDMMMPGKNGVDATKEIRGSETGGRAHIIALTANVSSEHRAECLDAGMDDYLSKPFTKDALFQAIGKYNPPSDDREIDRPKFDAFRSSLGPDSDPFVSDLIRDFLAEANRFRSAIHAGLDSGDAAAIRRAAHTLSSNCITFGAERLARSCRMIENLAADDRLDEIAPKLEPVDARLDRVCDEIRVLAPEPIARSVA